MRYGTTIGEIDFVLARREVPWSKDLLEMHHHLRATVDIDRQRGVTNNGQCSRLLLLLGVV